ncbi:SPASM domain-containing protein [Thermoanaerobacterium thermosulfurigenes]|uniref:SPASM domain-containing protein n=1 Tax=Thermoanaerobacterium thermosulfurigenes TaxID=33950 RepID=UPI003EF5FB63
MITDNIAKELSKYNIGLMQISLDGPNKIVYSGIRRSREAFTRALNGINNLKKYNIKISIAMVLMRENIDYILDLLNLAKSLNVDAVRFIDFIPVGSGNRSFCPTSQQLKKAYELILDYESKNGNLMIIKPQKLLSVLLKNDKKNNKISLLQYINHENKVICEAGNVIAHIKSNGDVTPCVYFREKSFICGNILCQDFSDIWINSNTMNQFRKLESIQGKCNKCKIFNMCMGGCRAYAYYTTGFLNGFDNRCWNIEEEN